jgi:hypothetical protein
MLLISCLHAETVQKRTPIASNGETVIVSDVAKLNVQVKVMTHEMQIGIPSDKRPDAIRSGCTYSKYPCSIVDYIDVVVNGKPIIVPRSVFCDLSDLNTAEVRIEQKKSILMLTGGDASESYIVKIEFDTERVQHRSKYWSEYSKDEPSEETIYHEQIMGD